MMETNDIVRKVAAEMLNTSMQDITAEVIYGWATRLGETCQESLQVQSVTDCNGLGNAVKMREALKYLRDASREFCHLILNSKYNAVYDKYKYPAVAKIRDAIAYAGIALSAPARNCDLYKSEPEAYQAYLTAMKNATKKTYVYFEPWLFAEAKGEELR